MLSTCFLSMLSTWLLYLLSTWFLCLWFAYAYAATSFCC
jgi:hypothetical protein